MNSTRGRLGADPPQKTLKNPSLFFQRIGGEGEKLLVSERGGCRVFVCITQTLRVSNIFIIFAYGTRNSQQD